MQFKADILWQLIALESPYITGVISGNEVTFYSFG